MRTLMSICAALLVAGMVMSMVSGCARSKVTKANYDKVADGMTQAEVEKILGPGTEKAGVGAKIGEIVGAGKVMTWQDGEKTITVTFVNDNVTAKAQQGL